MKLVFVLCTALTVLQILDVSTAANPQPGNVKSSPPDKGKPVGQTPKPAGGQTQKPAVGQLVKPKGTQITKPTEGQTPKSTAQTPKPAKQTPKPVKPTPKPTSVVPRTTTRGLGEKGKNKKPDIDDKDDNSSEVEFPVADVVQSSKILKNAVKRQASKTGSGFLNNLTRLLNSSAHVFGFLPKLARSQLSNASDIIKHNTDAISRTGDGATRGIIKTINSARNIGSEGEKQFSRVLSNAEDLGKSLVQLGGTAVSTPLSIGNNMAKLGNFVISYPSRPINKVMNSIKSKSSNDEDEVDDEKSEEP